MRIFVLVLSGVPSDFDYLIKILPSENFIVKNVSDFTEAFEVVKEKNPDLILLDLELKGTDGIEAVKDFRKRPQLAETTIVVFSEHKENYIQVLALNAGADDFMIKPVNQRLFLSKVRAWARKIILMKRENVKTQEIGSLVLDHERYRLIVKDQEVDLQLKEFQIFSLLCSRPGKVFSRDEIKARVWGENPRVRNRTIDVHIRNIRSKTGEGYVRTYKGLGYSFEKEN